MAIFNSSNPTLSEKIFNRSLEQPGVGTMTVRGSLQKFGFLMILVLAGAAYTWKLYYSFKAPTMMTLFMIGLVGGMICAAAGAAIAISAVRTIGRIGESPLPPPLARLR